MAGVSDWSATADENTSIDGINIAEHCPAKNMNDALRAVMAALKNKCDALDSTDNTLRRGAVIGEIRWFAMPQPPDGWLVCNGAAVSRTDYANLFAAIGTLYGAGNGSTTFNLPDARDRVLQGASGTHSVGSYIAAGLPNITGELSAAPRIVVGTRIDSVFARTGAFSYADSEDWSTGITTESAHPYSWHMIKLDASRSSSIYGNSSTVQPPALCLLPCIRYE